MESVKVVKKPHTINKIGKNHSILQQYVQKTCQMLLVYSRPTCPTSPTIPTHILPAISKSKK
jgi:hypothetical protein